MFVQLSRFFRSILSSSQSSLALTKLNKHFCVISKYFHTAIHFIHQVTNKYIELNQYICYNIQVMWHDLSVVVAALDQCYHSLML